MHPTVLAGSEPPKHDSTKASAGREAALVRLAGKARLLERLLSGDERMLAAELRDELEALAGPVAEIVSLTGRRDPR